MCCAFEPPACLGAPSVTVVLVECTPDQPQKGSFQWLALRSIFLVKLLLNFLLFLSFFLHDVFTWHTYYKRTILRNLLEIPPHMLLVLALLFTPVFFADKYISESSLFKLLLLSNSLMSAGIVRKFSQNQ